MTAPRPSLASPTPGCLQPREVQQFVVSKALPEDRQQHVEECASCKALLRLAQPDESRAAAFAETAARVWGEAKAAAPVLSAQLPARGKAC